MESLLGYRVSNDDGWSTTDGLRDAHVNNSTNRSSSLCVDDFVALASSLLRGP